MSFLHKKFTSHILAAASLVTSRAYAVSRIARKVARRKFRVIPERHENRLITI
jgi:hypothetical protein